MNKLLAKSRRDEWISYDSVSSKKRSRKEESDSVIKVTEEPGYYYISDELNKNIRIQWIFKNTYRKNFFLFNSCLQISFSDSNNNANVSDECICRLAKFTSFTINLKSSNTKYTQEMNSFNRFFFNFDTKVIAYSFINQDIKDIFYRQLCIKPYWETAFQMEYLIKYCFTFFAKTEPSPHLMIIFSKSDCIEKLMHVIIPLCDRIYGKFPSTIWGGAADEVSICRFNLDKHFCKVDTDIAIISISSLTWQGKICSLDTRCNSAERIRIKLRKLKAEIVLTSRSIAFMHISFERMVGYYKLDTSIFKEVFPNVQLFTFVGAVSFSGKGINTIIPSFTRRGNVFNKHLTSILLLSSN